MLVRYPSRLNAGLVYPEPVGTVDITPTLLGLAGIRSAAPFEGRDLASRLGAESKTSEPEVIFLRNSGKSAQWLAAVDARYKLVLSVSDRPWLFDSEADPDELLNFYGRPGTADVTRRLAVALEGYAEKSGDPHVGHARIAESLKLCLGQGAENSAGQGSGVKREL